MFGYFFGLDYIYKLEVDARRMLACNQQAGISLFLLKLAQYGWGSFFVCISRFHHKQPEIDDDVPTFHSI